MSFMSELDRIRELEEIRSEAERSAAESHRTVADNLNALAYVLDEAEAVGRAGYAPRPIQGAPPLGEGLDFESAGLSQAVAPPENQGPFVPVGRWNREVTAGSSTYVYSNPTASQGQRAGEQVHARWNTINKLHKEMQAENRDDTEYSIRGYVFDYLRSGESNANTAMAVWNSYSSYL